MLLHETRSNAKINDVWSFISTSLYAFTVWYIVTATTLPYNCILELEYSGRQIICHSSHITSNSVGKLFDE
jgi:hypothetical protein